MKKIAKVGNEPDMDGVGFIEFELLCRTAYLDRCKGVHCSTVKIPAIGNLQQKVGRLCAFHYILKLVCHHCFQSSCFGIGHVGNRSIVCRCGRVYLAVTTDFINT